MSYATRRPSLSDSHGLAAAIVISWLLTATSLVFALAVWLGSLSEIVPTPAPASNAVELKSLRVSLDSVRGENQALRAELDRLLTGGVPLTRTHAIPPQPVPAPPLAAEDPRLRETTEHLKEMLERISSGKREVMQSVALDLMSMIQHGRGSFSSLRDLYTGTTDPLARKILLAPMIFLGGTDARDFIIDQAGSETDPELRRLLLDQAAKYATPQNAGRLDASFIERLQSDDEPEAHLSAVRGLRFATTAEAEEALLHAAKDRDEKVRLAAIDALASRRNMRERLAELAAQDPSPYVRETAQCRLMVAERLP